MRTACRITVTVLLAVGALATVAKSAWAVQGYEKITGTFGKACENPCGNGQFNGPTGVAIDDETEDVYVVDTGDDRVEWFSANGGKYEGQFNGIAAPTGQFSEPESIAVDNDQASLAHGDVYVADDGHGVIDEFSATGNYITQIAGGRCENSEETLPCAGSKVVAFAGTLDVVDDTSGNLWVLEESSLQIYKFSDAGEFLEMFKLEGIARAQGLAVDSNGDIYVGELEPGSDRIYEYVNHERTIFEEVTNLEEISFAMIASTNRLLVDVGNKIELFGSPLQMFPSEGISQSSGVAVNGADGEGVLYASQRGSDDVAYFLPKQAEAPEIVSASATSTSREEGAFEVVIDPNNRNTSYHIEYSEKVSASGEELEGEINTITGTELPAEFTEGKTILGGALFENATSSYYYRVVATNELGTVTSKINVYTKLPTVPPGEVLELTPTCATIGAKVNPDFLETEYIFQLATKGQHEHGESIDIHGATKLAQQKRLEEEAGAICPGISLQGGAGTLPEEINQPCPISAEVEGLLPGETYYFRVVATNGASNASRNVNKGQPITGEWVTFTPYGPPAVIGGEASGITNNSADLSGEVNPEGPTGSYDFAFISAAGYEEALKNGAANPSEAGYLAALEHGAPSPYAEGDTTATQPLAAGNATEVVGPIGATGLRAATTYHYALVATNQYGLRTYGPDHTFTTQAGMAPTVSTGAASSISQTAATLSGAVSTNGLNTSYGFEVGTAPNSLGAPTGIGSLAAGAAETVSTALSGLQPGTVYYYRITATSSDGTVYGLEESFTTTPMPGLLIVPLSAPALNFVPPVLTVEKAGRGQPLTRAQKLKKALAHCRKLDRGKHGQRLRCEVAARKRYKAMAQKKHGGAR